MVLELYLDLLSQPCRAVYLFAKKNDIPFEFKDVALFKESILGSRFLSSSGAEGGSGLTDKITLSKKVPFLKDGDFVLTEGLRPAILLYLARKYGTPDHWYPSDAEKRARVDEYLFWHQSNMRAHAPKTLWIQVLLPLLVGQTLPEGKTKEVMDGLASSLRQLEELFLRDRPFLAGDEVSVADLVAIVELMQPWGVGCNVFQNHPRLLAWRERVEVAVGRGLFSEAHGTIARIRGLSSAQVDPQLKAQLAPLLGQILK
nr:PREDICTED: glutathione S-transferase theta-1 isoform X1 [Anolis carolinensis]|eukprot:XP_008122743.1 PREDICTED: glutathione S-transferase theta-1 isoform X1 [Anolis carolinensis]